MSSGAEQCSGADRANGSLGFKRILQGAAAHRGRSGSAQATPVVAAG
jgi:hypothetical protein